jgi:hypothetical protein
LAEHITETGNRDEVLLEQCGVLVTVSESTQQPGFGAAFLVLGVQQVVKYLCRWYDGLVSIRQLHTAGFSPGQGWLESNLACLDILLNFIDETVRGDDLHQNGFHP